MFRRVLIANRGAIARRVIRACQTLGLESVAVYSEADADAPYLAEASRTLPLSGSEAADTYLNAPALLHCLQVSGADAVHPGYGFLAEDAAFARAVQEAGAVFIGPAPCWLEVMGDKVRARELLAGQGFPVLPGSDRLDDADAALAAARALGYPLMLKPAAGGGGIGMRVVHDGSALARGFAQARRLASGAFGDGGLFLETLMPHPRHVEIQLLGDGRGGAVHLYERDCSLQQGQRKLIEEAPAPGLPRSEVEALAERAAAAAAALGYDNVGTLETLRGADGRYGFIEMNTRIQVEHGVTEAVTGTDLVVSQLRLAAGDPLPERPPLEGFAVEARVYATATGTLSHLRTPELFGVRFETGYGPGQAVTPHYDPLLAKVIGRGVSREQAIGRTLVGVRALEIRGVPTNAGLLEQALQDERFLAGAVSTDFFDHA
ncbi:MAG: acetyl-CoA carboxylase biotin carboxylase subunit [Pseudomonadota bacterium]